MTQRRINIPIIVLFLFAAATCARVANAEMWPIKSRIDLSSGFGDFRENRFHAGVDLRTGGQIGTRIYSPVDGYVWRVKMSYEGYGKGLYIKDDQGRFFVFGHLSGFSNKIGAVVLARQYAANRYYVDFQLPTDSVRVKKGEFIGLTGQTGAGAPHLHYEVRSRDNRPINPLLIGWNLNDKIGPTFERLGIALVDDSTTFDDGTRKVYLPVRMVRPGEYVLDSVPFINAPFGVLAEVYDRMRGGGMLQTVYKLGLTVNDELLYQVVFDSIDWHQGRSVNLEYDYVEATDGRKRVRRLFDRIGNNYPGSSANGSHRGAFGEGERPPTGQYTGKILAEDAFGNSSTLTFDFFWGPPDDFYEFDTLQIDTTNRGITAFLRPRIEGLALRADSISIDAFLPGIDNFDDASGLLNVRQETEGWLSVSSPGSLSEAAIAGLDGGRLAKKFPDGSIRYEQVMDDKIELAQKEHYPTLRPLSYVITVDGIALTRRWDGIYFGPVELSLVSSPTQSATAEATQTWQTDRFNFFIAPDDVGDWVNKIVTSEPLNDTLPVSIYKVGHRPSSVSLFDTDFRLITSSENFYEPRLIEIKESVAGKRSNPSPVTKTYQVLPEAFVTAGPFMVELRVNAKIGNLDKTGLCWWNAEDWQWVWINDDKIEPGMARGQSQGGGHFAAVTDLDRPSVRNLNIKEGMTVRSVWPEVRCDLVDSLSGIADDRSIDVRLNGDWLIPEYDPERETLVARPYSPVDVGKCTLTISVVDRAGNKTELSRTFNVSEK